MCQEYVFSTNFQFGLDFSTLSWIFLKYLSLEMLIYLKIQLSFEAAWLLRIRFCVIMELFRYVGYPLLQSAQRNIKSCNPVGNFFDAYIVSVQV